MAKRIINVPTKPATVPVRGATSPAPRKIAVAGKPAKANAANVAAAKAGVNSNVAPAAKPAVAKAASPAKPAAGITRTAATVAAGRYPFGNLTDRDNAYIAFYATLAKRGNGSVTLADMHGAAALAGQMLSSIPSRKPHDAGVIVRLVKAGVITTADNGGSITFTARGKSEAAYSKAR